MNNFTHDERITRCKIDLAYNHKFFTHILMNMTLTEVTNETECPTMAVDARGNLYYNPAFMDKLSQDELKGVLVHEAMHIVQFSFLRNGTRDRQLWNIATDLVINYELVKNGFKLPKDVLLPDSQGNWMLKTKKGNVPIKVADNYAEDIYEQILNHSEDAKKQGAAGQFDKHIYGKGDGNSEEDIDPSERARIEQQWKQKITEAALAQKMRGAGGSFYERFIEDLLNPKLDWRTILQRFIQENVPYDYTMRRPNRSFYATGVYSPSILKKPVPILIGIDVSGSIGQQELVDFVSEISGILQAYPQLEARVMYWSTEVDEKNDFVVDRDGLKRVLSCKFNSTGGTEISCVNRYLTKKRYAEKVCVFLTDGYVEGNPTFAAGTKNLFVISNGGTSEILKKHGHCALLGREAK